jgi:hypothetical protein
MKSHLYLQMRFRFIHSHVILSRKLPLETRLIDEGIVSLSE